MKWYWVVLIDVTSFLLGIGTGWLLTRKKNIDETHNGIPANPADSAAVQSIIERAKQRIHDLLHPK